MTEWEFQGILGTELKKLRDAGVDYSDLLDYDWEVGEDDTKEQVRSYVRSTILGAVKDAAYNDLNEGITDKKESLWSGVIKEFTDSKPTDVTAMFGIKKGEPLGGLTDKDYAIAGLMNGISADEVKRLANEYRSNFQQGVAKGAMEDAEAQTKAAPYAMAKDFDEGKFDDKWYKGVARNVMKTLRPMTYGTYLGQIVEKKSNDDLTTSLSPFDDRGMANIVETGMDVATIANPSGLLAKKVAPKAFANVGKARVSFDAAAPYILNPAQDGLIDAAGQGMLYLTNDRPYNEEQTQNVVISSSTVPSGFAALTNAANKMSGSVRKGAMEFNKGLRRGSTNKSNDILDLYDANRKYQKNKSVFDDPNTSSEVANTASQNGAEIKSMVESQYPSIKENGDVEGILTAKDWNSLMGQLEFSNEVAKKKSATARNKGWGNHISRTNEEKRLYGGMINEKPQGFWGMAGGLVSPASQQMARAGSQDEMDYKEQPWYQTMDDNKKRLVDLAFEAKRQKLNK